MIKNKSEPRAAIEDISTWVKYRKKLCASCRGSCCSMPVEAFPDDLVRMELMDEFELGDSIKNVARRLLKQHLVEHVHLKTTAFTLSRLASGDCIYLNQKSRRCKIYQQRPDTCRNHPHVGPRPGYCAYTAL